MIYNDDRVQTLNDSYNLMKLNFGNDILINMNQYYPTYYINININININIIFN